MKTRLVPVWHLEYVTKEPLAAHVAVYPTYESAWRAHWFQIEYGADPTCTAVTGPWQRRIPIKHRVPA